MVWRFFDGLTLLAVLLAIAAAPGYAQLPAWGSYPQLPGYQAGLGQDASAESKDPTLILRQSEDPRVKSWFREQNKLSSQILNRISGRDALSVRLGQLSESSAAPGIFREGAEKTVYSDTGQDRRTRILMRTHATGAERLVYVSAPDETVVQAVLSPDMSKMALLVLNAQLAPDHSASIRFVQTDNSEILSDTIAGLQSTMADIVWDKKSTGIFYLKTRLVEAAPTTELFLHKTGQLVAKDQLVLGVDSKQLSAGDKVSIQSHPRSGLYVAEIVHAAGKGNSYFYASADNEKTPQLNWKRFARPEDKIDGLAMSGEDFYLLSSAKSDKREVLKLGQKNLQLKSARTLLASTSFELIRIAAAQNVLYLHVVLDAESHLWKVDLKTGNKEELVLPFNGSLSRLRSDDEKDTGSFLLESALQAPVMYRIAQDFHISPLAAYGRKDAAKPVALSQIQTIKTADGGKIYLTLCSMQGLKKNSGQPVLLLIRPLFNGYPLQMFDARLQAWLDRGGVLALMQSRNAPAAIVTSKSKPGKKQVNLPAKQLDMVSDVVQAAEFLIQQGYASPSLLVLQDMTPGSANALLAAERRPELFAAVAAMNIASEKNDEIKPVLNPVKGRASQSMADKSFVYDELRNGQPYPAVFLAAKEDRQLAPVWMSAKLAAAMQILSKNRNKPVLLATEMDSSDVNDNHRLADIWSFFLWQTGEKTFSLLPQK